MTRCEGGDDSSPQMLLMQLQLLLQLLLVVLLLLDGLDGLEDHDGEDLVQGVHAAPLEPLGDGDAGVGEPELLQNVIHAVRVDLAPGPAAMTMDCQC